MNQHLGDFLINIANVASFFYKNNKSNNRYENSLAPM